MDNLLIFFDNTTFKINNVINNYIKRLITYEIIYKKIHKNEYSDIHILKSQPSLIDIKLNEHNDVSDINNILLSINNVIYKKYKSYENLSFKNIINKIKEFETITTKNKIIIICSIDSPDSFNESDINYINELFNSFTSDIKLINISNHPFFKCIWANINEYFINIRDFKMDNIQLNEIFNWDYNSVDLELYIKKILIPNEFSINIDKSEDLYRYLLVLNSIEKMISNNIENKLEEKINFDLIKQILKLELKTINNDTILNMIKSFQNSINNIIFRITDTCIKLPINNLNDNLSSTYIKYILEFYQIIYPKIYQYNNTISNTNNKIFLKNSKNSKNSKNETSLISLENIKYLEINDCSLEYLSSTLSLTNWNEEYNNFNPFGFLIKYCPNKYSYKGILDLNSTIIKTYPNMVVSSISTNWVGLYDYYQIILSDYEENPNDNNNQNKEIFNVNNFNITDNILGDGNVLLPVYINCSHWELTKSLWTYHISFINNCFEYEYNKKMDNLYFLTLLKLFNDLKNIDTGTNKKSTIRLFCYLLRTCIQILIDNKFLHSIKKDYSKYLELVLKTEFLDKNCNFSDWLYRQIQLIVSNDCEQKQLEKDIDHIRSYIFNKFIISNYKMDFWEMINDPNTTEIKRNEELDNLKNHVLQNNICWLYMEHDIKIFNKIIKSLYSIKGFNQFIKTLDQTNGCVVENNSNEQINIDSIGKIISENCLEQFDFATINVDISKYLMVN